MTARERRMSIVLVGFIIVIGAGFFGYQFVLSPLSAKGVQIDSLNTDIANRLDRITKIQKRRPDLDKWKKLSLPPDKVDPTKVAETAIPGKSPGDNARADLAQREYEDELNKMLRASGFAAADVAITPRKPDAKSAPQLATKKPIYNQAAVHRAAQGRPRQPRGIHGPVLQGPPAAPDPQLDDHQAARRRHASRRQSRRRAGDAFDRFGH